MWLPAIEKVAVVVRALALPKVTVPGPLTIDQVVVTVPGGVGRPSSEADPARAAVAGKVIV